MREHKGRIFRIAGVPGSGKTTATALITKLVRESGAAYSWVNSMNILCELAGVESEQKYRMIPEEKRRMLFPLLIQRITELVDGNSGHIWYFERHLCSMHEDGTLVTRGIPDEHGQRTVGQAIILAHEYQIALWREGDKEVRHDRHTLSPTQIALEQNREIEVALEASRRWGFATKLFFNQPGRGVQLASEIFNFSQCLS